MTVAQFEERLLALEQAVVRLEEKVGPPAPPPTNGAPDGPDEDEIIDGVEFDFVPNVPPKETFVLKGVIVSIEPGRQDLALSPEEWDSLFLERDDGGN